MREVFYTLTFSTNLSSFSMACRVKFLNASWYVGECQLAYLTRPNCSGIGRSRKVVWDAAEDIGTDQKASLNSENSLDLLPHTLLCNSNKFFFLMKCVKFSFYVRQTTNFHEFWIMWGHLPLMPLPLLGSVSVLW